MRLNKFSFPDIFIVLFCVTGSLSCVFFFYQDINASLTRIGEKPIGAIASWNNTVQRRFNNRLVWDRLRGDSPVYNGDLIRTANVSEASIAFEYGNIVTLSANSLVQVFADSSGSRIDFAGGGINVNANSATDIVITSGKNRLTVDSGTTVRVAMLQDGAFEFAVSEGAAILKNDQDTGYSIIEAGSGIQMDTSGEVLAVPQAVAVSPPSGSRFISQSAEGVALDFSWDIRNYPSGAMTRFEAAYDRNFNRILVTEDISGTGISFALPEGTWFWRIYPLTEGRMASQTEIPYLTVTVVRSSVPTIISPLDNQVSSYNNGNPSVRFQWTASQGVSSYILQVADNPSMQNPVLTLPVQSGAGDMVSIVSSALGEGRWYWRVIPAYDRDVEGVGRPSEIQSFVISQGATADSLAAIIPPAPAAARNEVVQRLIFPQDDYTVADTLLPDMRFTWKTNLKDTRFQLSQDSNFSPLLIDESAPAETYSIRSLQGGVYYWRIIGNADAQQRESQARQIVVASPLSQPRLNTPNGSAFSWQPSPGAEYYIFRLFSEDDPNSPVLETVVYDTAVSIPSNDFRGSAYTWSVQGMARDSAAGSRRTGLSAAQSVNITGSQPQAQRQQAQAQQTRQTPAAARETPSTRTVVLEYPVSGHSYSGIDASRNPGTVRWSSTVNPADTEFILARNSGLTDIVHRQKNVTREIALPRLTAGNYYWTIRASAADGANISPPAPSRFQVLPIPVLSAPRNRVPANSYTITAEMIRASRSIVFSWDAVQGANGYIMTIFHEQGAARRIVIQTPILTETSYTIEDIRELTRGNLFWQVEALYSLDEDTIDQRGRTEEYRLTIDIPAPGQIRTLDSGELYGR